MYIAISNSIGSSSRVNGGGGGGGFTNTYSLAFDGVDDYISGGDSDNLSFGNGSTDSPFSISAWIKLSSMGITFHILNKENNTTTGDEYVFYITSNTLQFAVCDQNFIANRQGRKTTTLTASEIDNVWCNVVATYDGRGGSTASDGINIYVNGVNKTDATFNAGSYTAMHNTTSDVKIGSYSSGLFANGNIDETAIFSSELTSANVTSLYNSGVPNDLTSLNPTAWYRMGDNGSYKSPQWLIPNNENKTKFSNYSFSYDGVDDYIQLSSVVSFASEFSLSIWVKPNGINTNQVILGNSTSSNNWVRLSSASSITFKLGSTSLNFADVGNNLVDGVWQHLLFYRDSSNNVGIFRNGTAFSTTQSNTNTLELSTIAKRGNIEYTGLIDEVAFWQSDKSSDVATIYSSGTPSDISSLSPVGYWRSENSTFSTNWTVTDNGSGSNDGTSANMTIEDRVGDASNSSNNAVSFNQVEADRKTDVPT